MQPRFLVKSITFSDGTEITTSDASIVVLVGPNNAGKSSTLREIHRAVRNSARIGPVLKAVAFEKLGSKDDLKSWLEQNVQKVEERYRGKWCYQWLGKSCDVSEAEENWGHKDSGDLGPLLCTLIDVEKRIEVANQQEPIDFFSEAPSHPVHVLYKDARLEEKVNEAFRLAFKADVVLNRGGGKIIAFHVGDKPDLDSKEDVLSPHYFKRMCELPFLHDQGHGMRSFIGCMLHSLASPAFVHLIDEPEAFLHPPHARLLAGLLARSATKNRQMVIATHSGDFVRGVLDANAPGLRIVRLVRDDSVNRAYELDSDSIRELWADPILRFSNVLDAVFHDGVVLCESDSDCRFYSAILNAVLEGRDEVTPDVMFSASGGKDRMPVLIRALQRLGVRIRVIGDFDILREERTLSAIVNSVGGDWNRIKPLWENLKNNVQLQTPPLSINQVRERILSALDEEKGASLSGHTMNKIKQALKATSAWHYAKLAGVNALPSGQPRAQLDELLRYLDSVGVFVVKCGEIERFVPSIGTHGPQWVAQALAKNLVADPELAEARSFISQVFNIGPIGWRQNVFPAVEKPKTDSIDPTKKTNRRSHWQTFMKRLGF